jgi:hypothetical protein
VRLPDHGRGPVECVPDEVYSVTYTSFRSADDLRTAFEAFASPADLTNIDCAQDPSAWHEYTVNGTAVGEVACYVEEGTSAGTTDSVIAWTDAELLVLGRAVWSDPADLTLYEWWRTETGPWRTGARSPHPPAAGGWLPRILEQGHQREALDATRVIGRGALLSSPCAREDARVAKGSGL